MVEMKGTILTLGASAECCTRAPNSSMMYQTGTLSSAHSAFPTLREMVTCFLLGRKNHTLHQLTYCKVTESATTVSKSTPMQLCMSTLATYPISICEPPHLHEDLVDHLLLVLRGLVALNVHEGGHPLRQPRDPHQLLPRQARPERPRVVHQVYIFGVVAPGWVRLL